MAAVQTIFKADKLDPATFTTSFAQAVGIDSVQAFIDSFKARLGVPTAYERVGYQYKITTAKGSIGCSIAVDQDGKINNLLFHDEMSAIDLATLQKIMIAPKVDPSWFQEDFAKDVPSTHIDDVLAGIHKSLGDFVRIEARPRGYFTVFTHGEAHAQISVTADGKVSYLAFTEAPKS